MRLEGFSLRRFFASGSVLACLLFVATSPATAESEPGQPQAAVFKVRPDDAATRSGFEHFYNMEYDAAIRDFERARQAHPDDPFAANHLLQGVLIQELHREGALDAQLYMTNEFLQLQPVAVEPPTRVRIKELIERARQLSDQRLKANPDDVDALYARSVTRGLQATYTALVEKAWFSALRNGLGAYHDGERVLKLSPSYTDAKLVVGIYNYVVGSLPWPVKAAAFLVDIHGSKSKGLAYMREAADGGGEASIDAKTSLAFFLAREREYPQALPLIHWLYAAYPHNFLYGLGEANLLKAAGRVPEAIAAYRKLLALAAEGEFPTGRIEMAAYTLGETLRQQGDYTAAAQAYETAAGLPHADPHVVAKADLAAGEMYDLLQKRDLAVKKYEQVIAADGDSHEAEIARRRLKHPYRAS